MVAAGGAPSSPQAAGHGCGASIRPSALARRCVPHRADWPLGGDASSSSGALRPCLAWTGDPTQANNNCLLTEAPCLREQQLLARPYASRPHSIEINLI
ncbi:hypothetical protein BDA96_05G056300 [Sorghum bicolor]|uniref:Uncharacterized protein n=1 Tax=Sorghum bicolor TaxID=4558 RepID=A0A921QV42_SORBI|nr:hypothetical protein BDA96_05G056300 [Sorghum bicolor]